ncbi:hypothetical protein Cpir12675_005718 [Ceratocystis pirilliformis]|uniref:Uncharacterized protein n=1 Tax=Ceratocystis pirilliformis TaxID=259994 RepID=A0ABR3YMN6_9PEZI
MSLLSSIFSINPISRSLLPIPTVGTCATVCIAVLFQPLRAASLPAIAIQPRDSEDNTHLLPAQIGGIVGSYAVSLVLVAAILLLLSNRRRERLTGLYNIEQAEGDIFGIHKAPKPDSEQLTQPLPHAFVPAPPRTVSQPSGALYLQTRNLSLQTQNLGLPSPSRFESPQSSQASRTPQTPTINASQVSIQPNISPVSSKHTLGFDCSVDQAIVEADKIMADRQLEEMYRHVLQHEEAKRLGVNPPPLPIGESVAHGRASVVSSKKDKSRPRILNLTQSTPAAEKQSKTSLFKQLLSPRRSKAPKELSISAPIMTPQSATFPRDVQELSSMTPRVYAPALPPPIPIEHQDFRSYTQPKPQSQSQTASISPPTPPDFSPASALSIGERLENMRKALPPAGKTLDVTHNPHCGVAYGPAAEEEPASSTSSHAPLAGLPASPRSSRGDFPALPASPRSSKAPGQFGSAANASGLSLPLSPRSSNFSRPSQPSAVRTGGVLPLRAYEPSLSTSREIAQTTFERTAPFTSMGAGTPGTSVPYTPYQPFSPVVPVTPSLVTKEERKRMKKMVPKTPTLEMTQSSDDLW